MNNIFNFHHVGTDTTTVHVLNPVNIKERQSPLVSIFPNPFEEVLNINAQDIWQRISLYDTQGRKVKESGFVNQLHVDDLESGMYVLQLENDAGQQVTKKVIKE